MRPFFSNSIFGIVITASCFCISCGNDIIYNKFLSIRGKAWDKQSEYYFEFEIKDRSIPYNILLQIRNNDIYAYQNLWLLCEELQPNGVSSKDTIECMLADDFGKWNGNGITLFQSRFRLRNHYIFPDTGKYTIGIRHGMRDENLKGIEDLGLFIEKAK
jgi:gliding motility-associated lipoprotein GldH